MIRTFLEYQIQRALDNTRALPGWLKFAMRCDPGLRQFTDDSQLLDRLLRVGACNEREVLFPEMSNKPQLAHCELVAWPEATHSRARLRKNALGWLSAAALAASVAIAAFSLHNTERQANAEHARFLSQQLTAVPEEMVSMLTLAVNKAELPRYNPLAQLKLPEATLLADISTETQTSLKDQFDSILLPWHSMGTDLLTELDQSLPQ